MYCLTYLDNIVVFSQTAEEHLHCLCTVFDRFREYNLKLKPFEVQIFQGRSHLFGTSSLKGWGVTQYLEIESNAEFAMPQTYTKVHAFLGLVGHYRRFVKGFSHIAQPLSEHLAEEGASRKSKWCSFQKMP